MSTEKFAALKASDKYDFWGQDSPKCPHCGHVAEISANDWYQLYEEGEHEVTCPSCDEDFTVSTRVSFSFSTDNQESNDV